MNNTIIIQCWSGKVLYKGDYNDTIVDEVLDANRDDEEIGYIGDFEVFWEDSNREDNIYEYINY